MTDISSGHVDQTPQQLEKKIFGKTTPRLIGSAAVFGVVFSYLFTRQIPGLNMLLFVIAIYAFAYLNRELFIRNSIKQAPFAYLLSIVVLFLAASLFFARASIHSLSIFIILILLLAQYLILSNNARHRWYSPLFLIDMFFGAFNRVLFGMGYFFSGTVNTLFKDRSVRKKGIAVGIAAGVALLIITVPFLLTADDNVANAFSHIFTNINFGTIILFLFLFVVGAAMATGPVATAKYGEFAGRGEVKQHTEKRPIHPATTAIALSMIGIVYVLFAAVQFGYFFAPRETLNAVLGLTSAAYAVKGFGELIYITCLNVVLIAVAMRFTMQRDGSKQPYLKVLYTLLILFNFVIMASSHLRMQCYEASFGYTVARFLSHGFMILLAALNVLILVQIYCSRFKAAKWFVVAALVYYCTIVAINPETYVVQRSIDRHMRGGSVDTAYMFSLSSSALPEVCDFAQDNPEAFDDTAKERAERALAWYNACDGRGWQSLNIADITAQHKLRQLLD